MKWKSLRVIPLVLLFAVATAEDDCSNAPRSKSDEVQRQQQQAILDESTSQVGMPAIKNFTERRFMKMVIEKRDQVNLATWAYTFSEQTGRYTFFCNSIGYGLPYATQYTNPSRVESHQTVHESVTLPQADPNGLFSPASADGTWVLCKDPDPKSSDVEPIYVEPRVIVSPFRLPNAIYP